MPKSLFIANDLIPDNVKGKPTDLDYSVELENYETARHCYMKAVNRMQSPGAWHDLAGSVSASFTLETSTGDAISGLADEGDYIRIDIPGPGPVEGGGFDWVIIEKMETYLDSSGEREWTGMKVRPCGKPGSSNLDAAHFFRPEATSTFIIERNGNQVTAIYHGRNEVPNTDTKKTSDNIRNAMISMGAIAGFSEIQWSSLIKGFLS